MSSIFKLFASLTLVALLGFSAMQFDAAPGSAASVQLALERSARAVIGAEDASWASVRMDGQKAILSGEAPTVEQRNALIARIAGAEGRGGITLGGVTAVDSSALTVASTTPVAVPYIFIAEHEGDAISLSGNVPDQASRDRLYSAARDLFPEAEISGGLNIADGARVSPTDWTVAAQTSLRALAHLRRGVVQADNRAFVLTGEADDDARLTAARALLNELPMGFTVSADITVRSAPESIEEIIAQSDEAEETAPQLTAAPADAPPEVAPETPAPSPLACVTQLEKIAAAHEIGFDSARIDIDNQSREHLRDIAANLADCSAARIRITGHTDSSGNAARNRQLSGYRADAVRAFLISVGAPANRLATRGAGSSEPLADNRTPAGRERNRRIEFQVTTEE